MPIQLPQGAVLDNTPQNDTPSVKLPVGAVLDQQPQQDSQGMGIIKDFGNFLFPIVGDVYHDIKGDSQKSFLQQAGDTGLSALPFIPGLGEAGEALRVGDAAVEGGSALSKGYEAWKALSPATKGAITGYGAGVSSNLSQGKGIGESIDPMDVTNVMGTLTGGVGAKVIPKLFSPFTKNLTQQGALNATQNALEEEVNRLKSNKTILNNLPNKGKDAFSLITKTDSLPEVKGTSFNTDNGVENLQNRISSLGQVRAQALDKIGETQSLDELAQQAKNSILSVPADASPAEAHLIAQRKFSGETGAMSSKIDKTITDIKIAHGLTPDPITGELPDLKISASDLEAMKESQMNSSGIFKRSGAIGDQNGASMLGEAAKTNIEKMAARSGFHGMEEYNNLIANHYDAIRVLQKLNGQIVAGGRLGNMLRGHTAGVIGAAAANLLGGGFWGTIASGLGAEGASHLFSKILGETTLSNPLRNAIMSKIQTEDPEIVQQLQRFLGNTGKVASSLIPKPSGKVTGKIIPLISSILQGVAMHTGTAVPGVISPRQPSQ